MNVISRTTWEEPGWTIGEHTDSGPQPWSRALYVVIHYTAAPHTPEEYENVLQRLRSSQRSYVTNRGYSYGYNWQVDRMGRIWQIRGDEYKCAANGNSTTNSRGPAILCLVNGAEPANQPMIDGVRQVIDHCERQAGRQLQIVGHRDVRATQCPGAGLYQQVQDGTFRSEGEDMTPLIVPKRVYDSRNTTTGRLQAGQTRQVLVGKTMVHAHVTVVDADKDGWLAISGSSQQPSTSLVNFTAGQIIACGAPIQTIDGRIRVTSSANCDFIVDIYSESAT